MLDKFLPKMRKGEQEEFRLVLKGDADAQQVITDYTEKVTAFIAKLTDTAEKTNTDVFTQFMVQLDETGSNGVRALDVTEPSGIQVRPRLCVRYGAARTF
jgi:hypothetical protein